MWLVVLAGVVVFLTYLLGIAPYKYWKDKGVKFVKPLPFVGNMGSNVIQRRAFPLLIEDIYNTFPDQRYVGFYQMLQPTLIIRDPELIKRITVKEADVFPEHRTVVPEGIDPLWEKNLFAIKGGERWHNLRSTLSPSFTSSKMKMMFVLMKDCAKQFTDYFQNQGGTVTVEMKDAFTRFTNDVIATTAFGVNCDSLQNQNNEFYLMGKDASNFTGLRALKIILASLSPTLMKVLKIGIFSKVVTQFFRKLITETLRVREEQGIVRPDMIHLLMEARKGRLKDEDSKTRTVDSGFAVVQESDIKEAPKRKKTEIADDDITAQALIFFLGGFDTASTFMCFTAYELAINPGIQEKLQKEVDQVLEECKGNFTYESLLGMKYLDMVVSESLRKWPPAVVGDRWSVRSFTIEPELPGEKPITLDKGTSISLPYYAIHRDPKHYPNPEKFDPNRFSDENKESINPYTYLPFGVGPRNCIGSRFALLEGKLVIAELLSKFEIVPIEKTPIPLRLDPSSANPTPVGGFWLGLKPRITCSM